MPSKTHLDALRLADRIRERLVEFAIDSHYTRDSDLTRICREIWRGRASEGGLLSELWVEGAFPAALSEDSLCTLASKGLFHGELATYLDRVGAMPKDRTLYTHQRQAIVEGRKQGDDGSRQAMVITAGTGAGKTECFLLPLLDSLFSRSDENPRGMRCLILYPMNALVNDQVDRLYSWLSDQQRVTLFHFTSETPEDATTADKEGIPRWKACRMRTRQEARGLETHDGQKLDDGVTGPQPDIIITNYSMLEYMLCRPQDAVFFGPSLRAVVLDEAHLYTGTLAAEITLLLRRLYVRCGVESDRVLQIATSATLGTGGADELRQFAAGVFSKSSEKVTVIQGERAPTVLPPAIPPSAPPSASDIAGEEWLDRPLMLADATGELELAESPELCEHLRSKLLTLTAAEGGGTAIHPAVLLWERLRHAPLVHRLNEILSIRERLPLAELARELWGESERAAEATVTLLQLAASARRRVRDYPLVPHRLHLLLRPTSGLVVCLNPECNGPAERHLNPLGTVSASTADRCPSCGGQGVMSLYRCMNCGDWLLAGQLIGNRYRPVALELAPSEFFSLRTDSNPKATIMTIGPDGSRGGDSEPGIRVIRVDRCANCGEHSDGLRPFAGTSRLTLAILAESLLAQLPEYPSVRNAYLPGRGRRLLAFSDSRQEAARLGPQLTQQHKTQLIRAAVVSVLTKDSAVGPAGLDFLRGRQEELQRRLKSDPPSDLRMMLEDELRQTDRKLTDAESGGALPTWANHLAAESRLAEILDVDSGENHQPQRETPKGIVVWGEPDWVRNREAVQKYAMDFLAQEFASLSTRTISSEKLGLAEVTYPGLAALGVPPMLLGQMPDEGAANQLQAVWTPLMESLCDTLRMEGSLTLGNRQADKEYSSGGAPVGQWCSKWDEGPFLSRFVGIAPEQRRRAFAVAVLKNCGIAQDRAESLAVALLEAAFDQLFGVAHPSGLAPAVGKVAWLEQIEDKQSKAGPPVPAIRLVFPSLGLRRPPKLYQCERTGHVWPRSVFGCAPERGCDSTLREVTDHDLDENPRLGRLRKEYLRSPVFQLGLWAEEHSAQLSPRENRRLQDMFKAGIRNILSATTTLELGIDIGGLTAVLMGNVPPGKANYLQRAGRAGRRADGSSAVLTFARPQPFDQAIFTDFEAYLSQSLRRPLIFLDRERVVRRHVHAYLLGEFFRSLYSPVDHRGAMNAFGNMGFFCGKPKVPYWEDKDLAPVLPDAPPDLSLRFRQLLIQCRDFGHEGHHEVIGRLLKETTLETLVDDLGSLLQTVIDQFDKAVTDWNTDYEQLREAWNEAVRVWSDADSPTDRRRLMLQANAIRYQLKLLWELTVIETLADRQFLPRYGFPIGLQKLRVIAPDEKDPEKVREEDQYRLERSGLLALGEYVPGSQLIAGGKLVTSRGLLKSWLGANLDSSPGLRGRYCRCVNDHVYYWIADPLEQCPICGGPPSMPPLDMLLVKYGFTSAGWDPPRRSTDVERVGQAETMTITFRPKDVTDGPVAPVLAFGGVLGLVARYREDGELLVFNRGDERNGFAICLKCGYAASEGKPSKRAKGQMNLPTGFEQHPSISATDPWKPCWKKSDKRPPVLRHQILAARETTDVLLLDFSRCLGSAAADRSLVGTLAYAMRRAAAQRLELDSRELGVILVPTGDDGGTFGIVLFDNVPGGAGHVRELLVDGVGLLDLTRRVLFINEEHDRKCESACLDCLLSFDAQRAMSQWPFVRRQALAVLDRLLLTRDST